MQSEGSISSYLDDLLQMVSFEGAGSLSYTDTTHSTSLVKLGRDPREKHENITAAHAEKHSQSEPLHVDINQAVTPMHLTS